MIYIVSIPLRGIGSMKPVAEAVPRAISQAGVSIPLRGIGSMKQRGWLNLPYALLSVFQSPCGE